MGGIHLKTPDYPPFPVDTQQLAYLIRHGFMALPNITEEDISDKSKADGFARALAVVQVVWFTLQCIGRWAQRLGICTLELSTLAFILCSLNMQFFWYFKPYDVYSPVVIETQNSLSDFLERAKIEDERANRPWLRTPLDFIKPPPDDRSLIAPFWFGVSSIFPSLEDGERQGQSLDHGSGPRRPINCFGNSKTAPPDGISARERLYGIALQLAYFGLHFLGVLLEFPSRTERTFWVLATSTLAGLLVIYLIAVYIGHRVQARFALWVFEKETGSIMELIEIMPRWAKVAIHGPFIALYVFARGYILVEGFVGLRALHSRLYIDVEWANLIPHM